MKRQLPFALSLLFLITTVCLAQEATPSPAPKPRPAMSKAQVQRNLIAMEKKLWAAWKNKDVKPFKSMLSADSVMIGDMGVSDKDDSIKELSEMACDVTSYELSDFKITWLDSNAALLTYKAMQDATCGGTKVPAAVWASSTFARRGGKWYATSHQETPAK